jgi:hypothetical protein
MQITVLCCDTGKWEFCINRQSFETKIHENHQAKVGKTSLLRPIQEQRQIEEASEKNDKNRLDVKVHSKEREKTR